MILENWRLYTAAKRRPRHENRQLPQRPGIDQTVQIYSDPSNEMVKSKSCQPLIDSQVSSKHSSESSRSDKCFICNKVAVLIILNVVLILDNLSAVPVYLSVGGQIVSEQGPTAMLVQQQPPQINKTCVSCSVLNEFSDHGKLGMEKGTDDLCCLKADTSLVEFIIKMRVASPTYTEAEDEEIYHARPILQLESMGLGINVLLYEHVETITTGQ
ncbi:uncharacterized protein LOC127833344 isoform X3 [Dreissena polymorpha]|uniref:uncharacterized protein LOC127833344 isoform X3 n=1 Tax=Dreissena polymorpha TaxID=45954 RepID=UPI0022656F06|nr:uncharacterized protein LOC127833344 isoform X3 [Dreissena polymorpha]